MKTLPVIGLLLSLAHAAASPAASGQELWMDKCALCHGADGKAQTPMGKKLQIKNFADAKVQADMRDDAMFKAIKEGKKSDGGKTLMPPAANVTDADISALMQVVRGFKP